MTKRPLTLTGAILNIVISSLGILGCLILFITLLGIENVANVVGDATLALTKTILMIGIIVSFAFLLPNLILSCMLLSSWKKEPQDYRTGIAIAVFVFDCIFVVSSFFNFDVWSIIIMLLFATAGALILIDIVRNYALKSKNEENNSKEQIDASITDTAQTKTETSELEKELINLKNMKENGLIDEEEHANLREKLLNKKN